MGVHGLWKLLEPTGRPVSLESLEGKVLAVDVSIWLNQAMYGMQGVQGTRRANAHLLVLFNRICKLLYYKIKPIFVFDGVAPELKKHTLHARRKRKELAVARAQRAADRIVKNYLKSHALHAISGSSRRGRKTNLSRMLPKAEREASIFELPPLPEDAKKKTRTILDEKEDMYLERIDLQEAVQAQYEDLNDIDINSEDFRSLSEEIQHEVITKIRESRKKPFWSRFRELPKKADDFSSYQLSRLLKKGKMTHRLDELQRDMKTKTSGDLAVLLDYETRLEAFEAGRVASEDTQHYILIRNQAQQDDGEGSKTESNDKVPDNDDIIECKEGRIDGTAINLVDEWFVPPSEKNLEGSSASGKFEEMSAGLANENMTKSPEEKNKKEEIKQEVWKFFQHYNSERKKVIDESGGWEKENERKGRMTRSSFIDEEELRNREKRKASEIWEKGEVVKKRKLENKHIHEEVTSLGKSKEASEVTSTSSRELRPRSSKLGEVGGFLGESDINLSDQYDSDEENNESCHKKQELNDTEKNTKSVASLETDKSRDLEKMGKQVENVSLEETLEEQETGFKESEITIVSKNKKNEVDEVIMLDEDEDGIDLSSKDEGRVHDADVVNLTEDGERMTEAVEVKKGEKEKIVVDDDDDEGMAVNIQERDREVEELEQKEEESGSQYDQQSEDMKTAESTIEVEMVPPTTPSHDELFPASLFQKSTESATIEEANMTENTTTDQPSSSQSAEVDIPAGLDEEKFESMQASLDSERYDLELQRGKDQRMAASVTEAMYNDSKELLNLFGIPYIESPQEAEAQCAFLDLTGQCEGVITDDSDVWLFGGQRVYKNFFTKDKDVLFYSNQSIERQLTLDRFKLISLGLLMGSDYTIGIQGVGFVTALEILSEFPGDGIESLVKFRRWWESVHNSDPPATESRLRSKLRKLALHPDFPSQVVIKAYLDPDVDKSKEKFTWNSPDLDLLRHFAMEKLGWVRSKTDELLLPVLKRVREKIVQGKISSYFFLQHDVDKERLKYKSKRVQEVLQKLSNPEGYGNGEEDYSGTEEGEMRDDVKRRKNESEEDEDEPSKKMKSQEDGDLRGKQRKGKQRKQSKGKIQKMNRSSGDVEMEAVDEISDEDASSSDIDQASVARVGQGLESDRGRHAWLGRNKRRKLFTKNNRGIGRSWKKHNWNDEGGAVEENETRMVVEEDEEEGGEEVEESEKGEGNSGKAQALYSNSQDVEDEGEKSDSYWENQISDTEYDIDELIAAGTANVAGKMIGGSRAGAIMKSLEHRFEESKVHEREGGDEDDSSSATSKRTKGRVVTREMEKEDVKGLVQRKEGSDASIRGRGGGSRQQSRDAGRNQRSDSDEEERSLLRSKRQVRGRDIGQRMNRTRGSLQKKDYEEEYRIEDEKEPEKDEEQSRMQAKRRAERNPYLKKQLPSKGGGTGPSGIGSQQFKRNVSDLGHHDRDEGEVKRWVGMGKEAVTRKGKEGKRDKTRKPDEAELEEYRIEEEVEPKREAAEEEAQMIRKVQRNPFLSGSKTNDVKGKKVALSTVQSGRGSRVKDPSEQASRNARSLRTRRNVNYFEGEANDIVGIPDLRKDSDYDSGVDEELDKDSGVDDGEDFVPRKLQLPPRQRLGTSGRSKGRGGGSKNVKGKGKQLLKKRTRFKSTAPSFSGPKLSESSSSDDD